MAAEHGSSSIRVSSKRRQGDGGDGTEMSDAGGRFLSPACAREPAVGGADISDSPTRFTGESTRASAVSPAAPTQDMTITELTHAYQHLAAQAGLAKQWATRVEFAITDHALWLDKHSRAGNTVTMNLAELTKTVANGANGAKDEPTNTTTGANGASGDGQPTDNTDAQVRAKVQAQDLAVTARLGAAEAALRELVTSLDTSLRAHMQ